MDVSATSFASTSKTTAAPAQSSAVLSSDFETFLKMLTAQARYQDPMEPIDSSEYAAQLAQFSMVEQQVMSNDLLGALGAQLGAGNMAQMAGWIGMEARTTAPVAFDGSPVTVLPQTETGADRAFLVVHDAVGNQVQRLEIPTSSEPLEWAGVRSNNSPVANGTYRFTVESQYLGKVIGNSPAESYARITEARREGSETLLILQGGSAVSATDVSALREPT